MDSDEAIAEMRQLARQYGLFVGPSSGAHIVAARRVKVGNPDLANIVTVFPDEGEKYISAYFSSPDNRNAL